MSTINPWSGSSPDPTPPPAPPARVWPLLVALSTGVSAFVWTHDLSASVDVATFVLLAFRSEA